MKDARGIALVAVLFALVLVGLFASGSFFVALEESRSGESAILVQRAKARAEGSLDSVLSRWGSMPYGHLGIGDSLVTETKGSSPGATCLLVVTRVGQSYFLVRSESEDLVTRQGSLAVVQVGASGAAAGDCSTDCDLTSYSDSIVAVQVWKMGVMDGS